MSEIKFSELCACCEENKKDDITGKLQAQVLSVSTNYLVTKTALFSLLNFVESCKKIGRDKFGACQWCKRHESFGHEQNCMLILAEQTAFNYKENFLKGVG